MKKTIAVLLALTIVFCLVGCNKEGGGNSSDIQNENTTTNSSAQAMPSNNTTQGSDKSSGTHSGITNEYLSNNGKTQAVKITGLDQLNFYAVKKSLAQKDVTLLSSSLQKPKIVLLGNPNAPDSVDDAESTVTQINPNTAFNITMYCYFTITISDTSGFLAQKLGGTGSVEVVITRNDFNDMITFKKGERYYSCLQTASTDKAMSFSSHKYVDGFQLVENFDQENYEYIVYFDGDKVLGMNCGRFEGDGNFRYVADDIKLNDNFCFVIHKKQSFTALQLEGLFASNKSFVDDGIVLDDGTVMFGESSVTDNSISMKDRSGISVINHKHIKKVTALYNSKFGFCIKLSLSFNGSIVDNTKVQFYLNNAKVRELTLQKDGTGVYITDLNNKSRMSDVFYKLTANNTNNRIGRILDHNDFVKEISKKLDLNDYDVVKEDHSTNFGHGLEIVDYTYTYDLKTDKSISYKASNYDVTIDGITITMPIKVSDFLSLGFTINEKTFYDNILQGGALFCSPSGNHLYTFIMNFYGNSTNFNDCYITQVSFSCYENTVRYNEGISPTRPDFEMLEGIHKDSTLDDIISRLGQPNTIILYFTHNQLINCKDCIIQLIYDVTTPSLPNGELVFILRPVLNSNTPSDFLTNTNFSLQ